MVIGPGKTLGFFANLFGGRAAHAASVPADARVYAIGDIHGCAEQMDRLLALIDDDARDFAGDKHLVFLGDYVDRGPDSKGVVDRLLAPRPGFTQYFLRGNHDQVVLDFLDDAAVYRTWRGFGAPETLMSYGVIPPRFDDEEAYRKARAEFAASLPASHLTFFRDLQYSARIGDYFFVHAGVRPGVNLDLQAQEDMLWIRDEFLTSNGNFGAVIVHGHTPSERPVRRTNRIGIDTGAYATGRLTAVVLEGGGCKYLLT